MYLMAFDIIDSRKNKIQITDIITDEVIKEYCQKFKIDNNLIEITGGDMFRLVNDNPAQILELIIYTYQLLSTVKLEARCFITVGDINLKNGRINTATGSLFYKNSQLEDDVKKYKNTKVNSIYYDGFDNTEELRLIFKTFSRLILNKPAYLKSLYMYNYQHKSQLEISKIIGISQSSVNNQLNKANSELISSYNQVITKLIEVELCVVTN